MTENVKCSEIKTEYLIAKRIVDCCKTENGGVLLEDTPHQAAHYKNTCCIRDGGYILLDFDMEICGGAIVTVQEVSSEDAQLRIVFGESVSESLSYIGLKNSVNDHGMRDMTFHVSLLSTYEVGRTGFRFIKIEAVGTDVFISCVKAVSKIRNAEIKGFFKCSDEMLTSIWNTAVRTVHLNMQEYIWDGVKRDRLVWVGDMHPEISTICCAFGYDDVVEKTLDFSMNTTPSNEWMNGLPSYTLWWLIIQHDWYIQNGRYEYLNQNRDYLIEITKNILSHIDKDGNIHFDDYFIDWETKNCKDLQLGFSSILVMALKAAEKICEILGESFLSKQCAVNVLLQTKCKNLVCENQQIAALAALAGICDTRKFNDLISEKNQINNITAFLGYYTLIAKGEAGDVKGAVEIIKEYWGRMIKLGATSFWESFDYVESFGAVGIDRIIMPSEKDIHGDFGEYCYKQFRKSLCHGWASGPAPFLSKYVLGIRPVEPGCRRVEINPCLAGLSWAKGAYPTPYGNIEIELEDCGGTIIKRLSVPKEIEIVDIKEEKNG